MPAVALALAALLSTGCSNRSDLFIHFGGIIPLEVTLKVRLRAIAAIDGVRPVANEIPAIVGEGDLISSSDGYHVAIRPEQDHVLTGEAVFVEVLLLLDDPDVVDNAFARLTDGSLRLQMCDVAGVSLPCSHEQLRLLEAVASSTFRLEHLGRSDANVDMFGLDSVTDADGDTFPVGCPDAATCEAALTDCNSTAIAVNPFELEATTPGLCIDEIDQDCNGEDGPCFDIDGDGFLEPTDCLEGDPTVNPDAVESNTENCSDGIDHDCDGGDVACACDVDGDGFCAVPTGGLPGGDCCETGSEAGCPMGANPALINPGVPELCGNGEDENCDGADGLCAPADADGDGHCAAEYGCNSTQPLCQLLLATVDISLCSSFSDCADWDSSIFPGAPEDCGGLDRNCDGAVGTCAADDDMDGWEAGADCDDGNPSVNPGAGEVCGNGLDDDCAGGDVPCTASTDADGDTYVACSPGVTTGCDCDDSDPAINPGADESCDGTDEDCDGFIDDGNPEFVDAFLDPLPCWGNPINEPSLMFNEVPDGLCQVGVTACSGSAGTCILYVRPAAVETCNGFNDTCGDFMPAPGAPNVPPDEQDLDGDGFLAGCVPAGMANTDCCDGGGDPSCMGMQSTDPSAVYPGAPEECNTANIDNDCDGNTNEGECGSAETCNGSLACVCGSFSNPSGEACDTAVAPECVDNGPGMTCGCADFVICDSDESCTGSMECECGGVTNPMGPVCDDGSPNPVCTSGGCACSSGVVCDADEACAGGSCECGIDSSGTGPACPGGSPNPTCDGMQCICDADSVCGSGESCVMDACECGGVTFPAGEACLDLANPECVSGSCGCDSNSTCDADETCIGGDCTCGAVSPASGAACPAGGPNPICDGMACTCDANSICDDDETCVTGACTCGATSVGAGPACPAGSPNPVCISGACACGGNSTCDADETCVGGDCACGTTSPNSGPACGTFATATCTAGLCDCDGAGALPACLAGQTCDAMGVCN